MSAKTPRVSELKAQLEKEKAELEALLAPAREFYEKHCNDPQYLASKKIIREVNAKLVPICNELAAIARAAGSKGIKVESGTYTEPSKV
jgi:hypothetical protein